jgi:regulator of protease activity HflC (stomatin/prohibitin superfamily)
MRNSINSVQTFLRIVAFVLVFSVLAVLLFPTALALGNGTDAVGFFTVIAAVISFIGGSIAAKMFFVLPEWEKLVLLRMGKYVGTKGPGYFLIPPFIYSVAAIVDTRIVTQQVEATATLTKDNVPTKATAAIEYEVESPEKAIINVKNYLNSIIWLSTEALKNTIGGLDLRGILSNREEIASQLKSQIDAEAANYGINVRAVRITDIDTPPSLIEELAVIARARRASEAKQIQADAEVAVARKMAEASAILSQQPGGFKLREIQNLSSMSKEESSMIIIYPSDSMNGQGIANASVAIAGRKK